MEVKEISALSNLLRGRFRKIWGGKRFVIEIVDIQDNKHKIELTNAQLHIFLAQSKIFRELQINRLTNGTHEPQTRISKLDELIADPGFTFLPEKLQQKITFHRKAHTLLQTPRLSATQLVKTCLDLIDNPKFVTLLPGDQDKIYFRLQTANLLLAAETQATAHQQLETLKNDPLFKSLPHQDQEILSDPSVVPGELTKEIIHREAKMLLHSPLFTSVSTSPVVDKLNNLINDPKFVTLLPAVQDKIYFRLRSANIVLAAQTQPMAHQQLARMELARLGNDPLFESLPHEDQEIINSLIKDQGKKD